MNRNGKGKGPLGPPPPQSYHNGGGDNYYGHGSGPGPGPGHGHGGLGNGASSRPPYPHGHGHGHGHGHHSQYGPGPGYEYEYEYPPYKGQGHDQQHQPAMPQHQKHQPQQQPQLQPQLPSTQTQPLEANQQQQQPQQPSAPLTYFQQCTPRTRTIAHYKRIEQIGEGTYGQVYKASCLSTNRIVALKKIRLTSVATEGLPRTVIREIKILKALRHENMVQMLEVVSSKGCEFLDEEDEHKEDKKKRLLNKSDEAGASANANANASAAGTNNKDEKSTSKGNEKNNNNDTTNANPSDSATLTTSTEREKYKGNLFLVLEYISHDLSGILDMGVRFDPVQSKYIFRQLLSVLDYMHEQRYVHRDLKSSNILIDQRYNVKLADFGLARCIDDGLDWQNDQQKERKLTNKVVTIWYRSPELLLGATDYDEKVDIWSAGCILAELLLGKALFPGTSDVEQLRLIFKMMGTPNAGNWEGLRSYPKVKSKEMEVGIGKPVIRAEFRDKYGADERFTSSPSSLALIERLLELDPTKRWRAKQALDSQYFRSRPVIPLNPEELGIIPITGDSHEFQTKPIRKQAKIVAQKASADAKKKGENEKEAYERAYKEYLAKAAETGTFEIVDESDKEKKKDREREKDGDRDRDREKEKEKEKDRESGEKDRKRRRREKDGENKDKRDRDYDQDRDRREKDDKRHKRDKETDDEHKRDRDRKDKDEDGNSDKGDRRSSTKERDRDRNKRDREKGGDKDQRDHDTGKEKVDASAKTADDVQSGKRGSSPKEDAEVKKSEEKKNKRSSRSRSRDRDDKDGKRSRRDSHESNRDRKDRKDQDRSRERKERRDKDRGRHRDRRDKDEDRRHRDKDRKDRNGDRKEKDRRDKDRRRSRDRMRSGSRDRSRRSSKERHERDRNRDRHRRHDDDRRRDDWGRQGRGHDNRSHEYGRRDEYPPDRPREGPPPGWDYHNGPRYRDDRPYRR